MKWLRRNQDKAAHFAIGALVGLVTALLASKSCAVVPSYLLGVFTAAVSGLAKELMDFSDYGVFDRHDLLATVAGGGLVGMLVFVV